jgi:hypothetical protein
MRLEYIMAAQSDPPAGDGLAQALAVALDAVLRRRAAGQDRVELLKRLRSQLEKVLTRRRSQAMPWRQSPSEPVWPRCAMLRLPSLKRE